jgi:hypothetical protein
MLKWLLTLLVVLVILAAATPLLGRITSEKFRTGKYSLGNLPGDFRVPVRGRFYYVPFGSTVLLSLLVWLIGKIL